MQRGGFMFFLQIKYSKQEKVTERQGGEMRESLPIWHHCLISWTMSHWSNNLDLKLLEQNPRNYTFQYRCHLSGVAGLMLLDTNISFHKWNAAYCFSVGKTESICKLIYDANGALMGSKLIPEYSLCAATGQWPHSEERQGTRTSELKI